MRYLKVVVLVFVLQSAHIFSEMVTIALCRPQISQIKNIEQLYEKNILSLEKMQLVCIYHENEVTNYKPALKYVVDNKLSWVKFKKITGFVAVKDLFKQNLWTWQFKEIFKTCNAIIFTGGSDIPPAIYGEQMHLLTRATTPIRTMYEVSFLFHLIGGKQNPSFYPFLEQDTSFPILAICLGCQTMNVAAGGSLYQDIPSQVYKLTTVEQVLKLSSEQIHSSSYIKSLYPLEKNIASAFHRIRFNEKSLLQTMGSLSQNNTPYVLSSHHQAVKKVGQNLKITATSMDKKIVEALEHKKYPNVLGVQFHPEYYPIYQKGRYYRKKPGAKLNFNPRKFLKNHNSMKFHLSLWNWFAKMSYKNQISRKEKSFENKTETKLKH